MPPNDAAPVPHPRLRNQRPRGTAPAQARCYYSAPMGKTREIKKRIKAVGNIRRITKTMQMIATSKFARAQQASVASKPYTEALFQLVTELAASLGDASHPLLDSGKKGKRAGKDLTLILT